MDPAKTLIRTIVRAFYETKHVLVVDALMVHSALPNEDLAFLLGMQAKELRKLCGKLKEDRLLAVHSRQETREGQQRPINKDYYYIDFHATIDAIKYRIYQLTEKVKGMYKPSQDKKDFYCPRCKAQWTALEAMDKLIPEGFGCNRCGGVLEKEESVEGKSTGHEKQSKLMGQIDGFLKMLRNIDSVDVPKNDFDTAFSLAVPVQRDQVLNPLKPTVPLNNAKAPPTAVKGITQAAAAPLDVSVTTGAERSAAEQAAEAQRKAEIAAQNVLPVWHTTSTVTGQKAVVRKKDSESTGNGSGLSKGEQDEKKDTDVLKDELAAYYAQMAQEKEKEAREDQEADESSGGEDEDFEDVGLGQSAVASPSSSINAGTDGRKDQEKGRSSTKRKSSESGSSTPATNGSTPAASGALGDGAVPVTKRVKFESQEQSVMENKPAVNTSLDRDSDEDEEAEFEDAL